MKQFIKKIFGIDKIEEAAILKAEHAAKIALETFEQAEKLKEETRIANLTPKERATENREPWIAVLETHVNKDNIRNGFFELDWNEYFVLQLRAAGYVGETDESIVDQWFSELCKGIGNQEGVDMSRRGAGYINVNNLGGGKTEVF